MLLIKLRTYNTQFWNNMDVVLKIFLMVIVILRTVILNKHLLVYIDWTARALVIRSCMYVFWELCQVWGLLDVRLSHSRLGELGDTAWFCCCAQMMTAPLSRKETHRIVWVGRDLKDHLAQPPCKEQGHLPLDQVAQSPVHPGLKWMMLRNFLHFELILQY